MMWYKNHMMPARCGIKTTPRGPDHYPLPPPEGGQIVGTFSVPPVVWVGAGSCITRAGRAGRQASVALTADRPRCKIEYLAVELTTPTPPPAQQLTTYEIIEGYCLDHLVDCQCIFADIPDNIGLKYAAYDDSLPEAEYLRRVRTWLEAFVQASPIVWMSFNARHTPAIGSVACEVREKFQTKIRPCIQVFTFYQHNNHWLGNGHRPLWCFHWPGAKFCPEQVKVPSWREQHGDRRAKPGGKVPSDVFDFPRVTGNSKERRNYHPTQISERLVERCVLFSTRPGDLVLDPFAGTGTTLRVCKRIDRRCRLIEIDPFYVKKLREEHG